jgi:Protein of unknown function (DUF2953).
MLHIVLGILKIIGIILVSIVGLLLLLLLLGLFFPITYIVKGEKTGAEIAVKGRVHWLFHAISIKIWYEGTKQNYIVRVFGFSIMSSTKEEKKKRKSKYKKGKKSKKKRAVNAKRKEAEAPQIENRAANGESKKEITTVPKEAPKKTEQKKKNIWDKPKEIWQKIKSFYKVFLEGIKKAKEMLKKVFQNLKAGKLKLSRIIEVIKEEGAKEVFSFLKAEFVILLKHIRPRKIKGRIHFGTADPMTTGYITGGLGIMYSVLPRNLIVQPDFEQEIYEGNLYMKGRIQSYVLIRSAWRIYKNKKIKAIIASIKD